MFQSPANAGNTQRPLTSHGLPCSDKVETGGVHGRLQSFYGQLPCKTTPLLRYRTNDYLYPNNSNPGGGGSMFGNSAGGTNAFGAQAAGTGGLFGNQQQQQQQQQGAGIFGNSGAGSGMFGNSQGNNLFGNTQPTNTGGMFGNTQTNMFGQPANTVNAGLFGNQSATNPNAGGLFGNQAPNNNLLANTGAAATGGLFGNVTQPANAFGATNTNAGMTSGGNLFGNNATTGNLFGNTASGTTGGGLFGNNVSTTNTGGGLFGNTTGTTNTGTGLFGNAAGTTNTGTGLFGNTAGTTNTGTGLFGNTNTTGNMFGNTATNTGGLFGNSATTNTGTGSFFGNTANNAASGSLFGNQAGTTNATGTGGGLFGNTSTTGGLFGNNAAGSTNTGGLFGNATGTGATSGGLFGNTTGTGATGGLFGNQNTNTGAAGGLFGNQGTTPTGGLFGNTTAGAGGTSGGLFGNNAATTNTGGTGLFGSTSGTTNTGGGLFGNLNTTNTTSGGGLFGNTNSTFGTGTQGGGLFGNANTGGGLFGSTSNNAGGGLFGSNANANRTGGLFGTGAATQPGSLFGSQTQNPPTGASVFGLYGTSAPTGTQAAPAQAPLIGTPLKEDPYQLSAIAITNAASILYGSPAKSIPVRPPARVSRPGERKHQYLSSTSAPLTPRTATPERKPAAIPDISTHTVPRGGDSAFIPIDSSNVAIEGTISAALANVDGRRGSYMQHETLAHAAAPADPALLPISTKSDYTCRPSIEALKTYSEQRLSAVEDFTVAREGYGSITWEGLTDVRGLDIDSIVLIESKAVEVYGDHWEQSLGSQFTPSMKPPIGQGLNKKARVTLYNCRPSAYFMSSKSQQEVFDAHRRILEDYAKDMNMKFISLTPDYTWCFEVEHFSRYAMPVVGGAAANAAASPETYVKKTQSKRKHVRQPKHMLPRRYPRKSAGGGMLMLEHKPMSLSLGITEKAMPAPQRSVSILPLIPFLTQPVEPLNPGLVAECIVKFQEQAGAALHEGTMKLIASLWRYDTDLLGGLVSWLEQRNREWLLNNTESNEEEDSAARFVHELTAGRVSNAAEICQKNGKLRLGFIVSSLPQPELMAHPCLAEQLLQYQTSNRTVADPFTKTVLHLASGCVDGSVICHFKTWTQFLYAGLVFDMNVNHIRATLPTLPDQIKLLQCALAETEAARQWPLDTDYRLLQFLVSQFR